jgi:hypothetical protein
MLRPTVSLQSCFDDKHPSGVKDQIFIISRHFRICSCGASSLARGRVCCLQLLLTLANAVILWSESHGIHGHILLYQIRDSSKWRTRIIMAKSYPQELGSLFAFSDDRQGYGVGFRTRFHKGRLSYSPVQSNPVESSPVH